MTTSKAKLHDVLLKLRVTFETNLEELQSGGVLDITGAGYTNHQADDATMVYDQTAAASALRAAQDRLRQVEEALARHAAGTYGICENCGQEIDIARLEAIPYTPVCLRCAEAREYLAGI